jgi:hypothetical protein
MREAIRKAVEGYFHAEWRTAPAGPFRTPIDFPNTLFDPPQGAPWVRIWIIEAGAGRAFIGHGAPWGHRTIGRVVVQVFVPARSGLGTANTLADIASKLFAESRLPFSDATLSGTLDFQVPTIRAIPLRAGEEWQQVNVEIPYEATVEQLVSP